MDNSRALIVRKEPDRGHASHRQHSEIIEAEAERRYREAQSELSANQEEIKHLDGRLVEVLQDMDSERNNGNISASYAKVEHRWARVKICIALSIAMLSSIMLYWSLSPSFYGNELLAALLALGGGVVCFMAAEMLLEHLAHILNQRQLHIFIVVITLMTFSSAIGGGILFSKARAIQWRLNQNASASVLDSPSEDLNVDEAKKQIDKLNGRGMILLFIGLEWLAGLLAFNALTSLRKCTPMVSLSKTRDALSAQIVELKKRNSYLAALTKEGIKSRMMAEEQKAQQRGSPALLVCSIAIIVGMVIFFFLLSEDAFGKNNHQCTYYLVAFDVTGSTDHDRLQNQRAVLTIIDSLNPCDEIQIMLITQATFSNPEYMIRHTMPSKAGYFNEEVRRKKIEIINEFRKKAETLLKERPATSLIDGIYLFARLLNEQRGRRKVLVILSDMRQFAKEISEDMIAQSGEKIIAKLKAEGLIPDMKGIDIYVMGASTAGMSIEKWKKLERFWTSFFSQTGASLKCYDIGRQLPIE